MPSLSQLVSWSLMSLFSTNMAISETTLSQSVLVLLHVTCTTQPAMLKARSHYARICARPHRTRCELLLSAAVSRNPAGAQRTLSAVRD